MALVALAVCLVFLGAASWRHRRNLKAVPARIHVAGTRGKSTTTRMIAAGLRAGGRRVVAKSTGSQPRLILPDGSESAWPRRGPASVREQARFFAKARQLGADTGVVECMAIRPELVWASEAHLVRATTAVITNTRADHYEEIGDRPEAAAEALSWVIPKGGRLIVAAEALSPAIKARAATLKADLTVVEAPAEPRAANRALALAVCAAHGVSPDVAGPAIDVTAADPGAYFERDVTVGGKTVRFRNAFACNDVESLALLWRDADAGGAPVVLLNARRDRPLRTQHFLAFLAAQIPPPTLFVTGDPLALRLARRSGLAVSRLRARTATAAIAELVAPAVSGGSIWGVGNYQGLGARLVAELTGPTRAC
jgi:poly-gamma-glutamate synthase PgsB/CapB